MRGNFTIKMKSEVILSYEEVVGASANKTGPKVKRQSSYRSTSGKVNKPTTAMVVEKEKAKEK